MIKILAAIAFLLAGCASTAPTTRSAPAATPIVPVDSELAVLTFDSAWSLVARAHYDTSYNGVDWAGVRDELRPRAAEAVTMTALRGVLIDMVSRLGESHYNVIPGGAATALEGGSTGAVTGEAGLEVRLVGAAGDARSDQLVVWRVADDGAAASAGVRTGWTLVAIDERPVASRLNALAALPASEQRVARTRLLFQVNAELTGATGDTKTLTLRTDADTLAEVMLDLRERDGQVITFGSLPPTVARLDAERLDLPGGCVGIIRFTMWLVPLSREFDRAVDEFRDCNGMVIDLRGNPGGVAGMVMGAAGHFVNDTLPLGYMRTRTTELRFKANPRRARADGTRTEPFAGKLAILTDELTASTSEFFADGLQAVGRARVFGTRSAGQALPAMMTSLPNGDVLMYVVADFTGPRGSRVEGRGVQPDVVVETTKQDLLLERDAPMIAALNWIAGGADGSLQGDRRP